MHITHRAWLPLLAAGTLWLAGCGTPPRHPALQEAQQKAQLPPLIPVRDFVANTEGSGNYRISPDGRRLAWLGTSGLWPAVWVKTLGRDDARALRVRAGSLAWSGDGRRLLLSRDPDGSENTRWFAVTVDQAEGFGAPVSLFPEADTRASLQRTIRGTARVVLQANLRDKKVFEPFLVDLDSGRRTRMAANPGTVTGWLVDRAGTLRGRVQSDDGGAWLQLPGAPGQDEGWHTTVRWGREESLYVVEIDPQGSMAWALSARGRDKSALVRLDLATGQETVVESNPEVDISRVLVSRNSGRPLMVHAEPGYPVQKYLDAALQARLEPLGEGRPAAIHVNSLDDAEQAMTVSVGTDRGTRFYLVSGPDAAPELLGQTSLNLLADALGEKRPVRFQARDGLTINGYLTLPPGVPARGLPMVLLVHGGPWARDGWSASGNSRGLQQFLANRGYAVLQLNYRGSTGYGRAFMEKAVGEFAGRMHDDLVDGVRWAVQQGVADPARVAVWGASYGGYAALLGATLTPEVFACAVDVVGVSDLARLLETAPPYWALGLPWWKRYVGDPADPVQRKAMDARSPVYMAANARVPILVMHGVNDVRVKLEQSQRMVQALREHGKTVRFVTFGGDGHGNYKWNNNLKMYRETEDFLAGCLGGRSAGFDYYQLGAWAF